MHEREHEDQHECHHTTAVAEKTVEPFRLAMPLGRVRYKSLEKSLPRQARDTGNWAAFFAPVERLDQAQSPYEFRINKRLCVKKTVLFQSPSCLSRACLDKCDHFCTTRSCFFVFISFLVFVLRGEGERLPHLIDDEDNATDGERRSNISRREVEATVGNSCLAEHCNKTVFVSAFTMFVPSLSW
jgi:hypothetical protein